jgi:hypothetical protein
MIFVGLAALVLTIAISGTLWLVGKKTAAEQVEEMSFFLWFMLGMIPILAVSYSVLALFFYNTIGGWLGWPTLLLPWWHREGGENAVALSSWQVLCGLAAIYVVVTVWTWLSWHKPS